mmetsp:Transcript_41151/g.71219  ORF Transcript_41151/g.71219 Transcript_41151/m.71219 type:complete len:202 (+) Transcript_41151:3302-3907(+)
MISMMFFNNSVKLTQELVDILKLCTVDDLKNTGTIFERNLFNKDLEQTSIFVLEFGDVCSIVFCEQLVDLGVEVLVRQKIFVERTEVFRSWLVVQGASERNVGGELRTEFQSGRRSDVFGHILIQLFTSEVVEGLISQTVPGGQVVTNLLGYQGVQGQHNAVGFLIIVDSFPEGKDLPDSEKIQHDVIVFGLSSMNNYLAS